MNDTVTLCRAADVAEGRSLGVKRWGVFVLRHAGQLHAWRDACPHHGGTPMAWRRDEYLNRAGTRVVCASHGAQFEPDTGLCVLGPCIGQSLTRVQIEIDLGGNVEMSTQSFQKDSS